MNTFILLADIFEKMVLGLLAVLSVWSVAIMIDRSRRLKKEKGIDIPHLKSLLEDHNLSGLRHWCEQHHSVFGGAILAAVNAKQNSQAVDRAVASYLKENKINLEKGLSVLATLGTNAPFVGLFGTVLGIIRSFAYLGMQSGSSAVMSGISQALVATAVGLFVAIPAVVAFNYFSKSLRDLYAKVESMRDFYVAKMDN